jgi:hypothetical protein
MGRVHVIVTTYTLKEVAQESVTAKHSRPHEPQPTLRRWGRILTAVFMDKWCTDVVEPLQYE